jgi:hypothetical protein
MKYEVHGPFPIQKTNRLVDHSAEAKRLFWAAVDELEPGLSKAVGCYIFCIGKKPWYAGVAERQAFNRECFALHKIVAFNSALNKVKAGKPQLVLMSKMTNRGRFAKPSVNGHRASQFLEDMIIGMTLAANPEAVNIKGTKFPKELSVPGVINTPKGKGSKKAVQFLRSALRT